MAIQPYLSFEGRCDEAIEFYKKALGAEVQMLMRWKDAPDKSMSTPTNQDKVMHASLKIGDGTIMASDGRNSGQPKFEGISLSIAASNTAEAEAMFKAVSEGGEVAMPLGKTFFAASFGVVRDKFGVHWMIISEN